MIVKSLTRWLLPLCLQCALASWCAAQTYTISTLAGNGTNGYSGDGGAATSSEFADPTGVAVDSSGNVYIADQLNHRIRKVAAGGTVTTVAGNGTSGYTGDSGSATSAEISSPEGAAVDSSGNLYIADTTNSVVRKVSTSGTITTIAGSSTSGFGGDGAAATNAQLLTVSCVAVDSSGNLYISDTGNDRVRKVAPDGTITTIAGTGLATFGGDGGQAASASLNSPQGLAVDAAGNLYIADSRNARIRKVTPDGMISTIAGTGTAGFSGDGHAGTAAKLNNPEGVAVDAAGNLYIVDTFNNRIRKLSTDGTITTIAGDGTASYWGDGGPALNGQFRFPFGIAVDAAGKLYVADAQNNVIRVLTPVLVPPAISAGGVVSAGAFGGFSSVAPGSWIEIYGSALASATRSWATSDFNGINAPTSLGGTQVTIGGKAAFVSYVSANQIDAQVPADVGTGSQDLVVTTPSGTSSPYTLTVNSTEPGLFAPASLNVGGKQYAGALFPDGATYVLPSGSISGITSHDAHPGDTIILYGVGFGPVDNGSIAGQVAQQSDTVASPVEIRIGNSPATVSYMGLAPEQVGLYQFNVVVPNIAASDAEPLTFTLGGVPGTQTLYTAVQN